VVLSISQCNLAASLLVARLKETVSNPSEFIGAGMRKKSAQTESLMPEASYSHGIPHFAAIGLPKILICSSCEGDNESQGWLAAEV
jgi:hypothetical protein